MFLAVLVPVIVAGMVRIIGMLHSIRDVRQGLELECICQQVYERWGSQAVGWIVLLRRQVFECPYQAVIPVYLDIEV